MDLTIHSCGTLLPDMHKEPNVPQPTKLVRIDEKVHSKAEAIAKQLGFSTVDELIQDVVASWVSFIS